MDHRIKFYGIGKYNFNNFLPPVPNVKQKFYITMIIIPARLFPKQDLTCREYEIRGDTELYIEKLVIALPPQGTL